MSAPSPSPSPSHEELTQFGIREADEGAHPFDPDDETWNESIFYDWYDAEGTLAGHCRIGNLPVQGRCWFWFYLYQDGVWLGIDQAYLPMDDTLRDDFSFDGPGLRFSREVVRPLLENRLRVEGTARVLTGAHAGELRRVGADLTFHGVGPCHSIGDRGVDGHTSEDYEAVRFEQPIVVSGTQTVAGAERAVEGRGERDHSWGPRFWNMEWSFLAVNGPDYRLQAVRVRFDEDAEMDMGYFHTDAGTAEIEEARFALAFRDDDAQQAVRGAVTLVRADGTEHRARIEPISGAEIDASHVFMPPQPSQYRRSLVRFYLDGSERPALGWLEVNRFPNGMVDPDVD